MKKLIKIIILCLCIMPLCVFAKGSINVSTKSITLSIGGSSTFKISASNAAGRVDISSSDTSVATVSKSNAFLDNDSISIKVTAKKEGTAKITVKISDAATYDEEPLKGSYAITVTVKEKTTTTKKKKDTSNLDKNNNLTKLCAEGYTCTKKSDDTYILILKDDVKTITIEATKESNKAAIKGTGKKEISELPAKFTVTVTSESGNSKKYYLEVTQGSGLRDEIKEKDEIKISNNVILDSDTLEIIKESKKIITLTNEEAKYSWVIDGSKIKDDKPINLDITSEKFETSKTIDNGIYLTFAHLRALPENTKIIINVEDTYKNNQELYLYYYDDISGSFNYEGTVNVDNGKVTLELSHGSKYILTKDKLTLSNTTTNYYKIATFVELFIIIGLIIGFILSKRKA